MKVYSFRKWYSITQSPQEEKENGNRESKASVARMILTLVQRLSEQVEHEHDSTESDSDHSASESLSIYDETQENEVKLLKKIFFKL